MSSQGPWPSEKIVWRHGQPYLPEPPVGSHVVDARLFTPENQADFKEGLKKCLGNGQLDLDKLFSSPSVLGSLCESLEQYIEKWPGPDHERGSACFLLGTCLLQQYITNTIRQDAILEKSRHYLSLAIAITPKSDPLRGLSWARYAFAHALQLNETGDFSDLSALRHGQLALDAATTDEVTQSCLGSFGSILRRRYQKTKQFTDIKQGILYLKQALELLPVSDKNCVPILNTLATLYSYMFSRTSDKIHINLAIQYTQTALKALTQDSRGHSVILNNLASYFLQRFHQSSEIVDIDSAIQCGEQVLAGASLDDPDRSKFLQGLGVFFKARFTRTHKLLDLEQAIRFGEEALKCIPEDHPDLAGYLCHHGDSLHHRFILLRNLKDLSSSFRLFCRGFLSDSDHIDRLRCGFRALQSCSFVPPSYAGTVADLAEDILEATPRLLQRTHSRNDAHYILQGIFGLASLAVSLLLLAKRSALHMIQLLESSRGTIISSIVDMKADISGLKEQYPDLWCQYTQCRDSLGTMNSKALSLTTQQTYASNAERLQELYQTLDNLKFQIRRVPGFERFLLSPTEKDILGLARHGPVVVFNVSSRNSAAFLIADQSMQIVSLPDLEYRNIQRWVKMFPSYGNYARRDAELSEDDDEQEKQNNQMAVSNIRTELIFLWKVAVKPVLQNLGMLGRSGPESLLPRVWWVTAGIMGLVPLHAAGDHSLGSAENTLSHVVSSYAPTLKSLQFVLNQPPLSISTAKQELLLVSMPTTPGGHELLGVSEEVRAIEISASQWASITNLKQPDKSDVLQALETCTIAHFACHGSADPIDPTKSALLVGSKHLERLTIDNLEAISCQQARLVYLSACSTAETKKLNLADESVHLASTFQLAGFQHVIGTLWGADDTAAAEIAQSFYETLPQQQGNGDDSGCVARALHHAMCSFRNKRENRESISKWAPFIHLGS